MGKCHSHSANEMGEWQGRFRGALLTGEFSSLSLGGSLLLEDA